MNLCSNVDLIRSLSYRRSIVVNHLQAFFKDSDDVAIMCIYCDYKDQASQTVPNFIASLLKQIVQDCRTISTNMRSFYTRHPSYDTRPTLNEFTQALQAEIGAYSKVFVVVDALDECPDHDGSWRKLLKTLRSLSGPISLMVMSRYLGSITEAFKGTSHFDILADDEDVKKYIESELVSHPHLEDLKETIVEKIVANICGM
jgi:hypothetical protein